MIYDTQLAIEAYFQDNWVGVIHYNNTSKHPQADTWIYLEVEPIENDNLSMTDNCITERSVLYVTCYHSNKAKAAQLADEVVSFIQNKKLGDVLTQTYRPSGQGEVYSGCFFYKVAFGVIVEDRH